MYRLIITTYSTVGELLSKYDGMVVYRREGGFLEILGLMTRGRGIVKSFI